MRIKDLFTVPTNQKVTEKHLYRVLISSVCSILLCMASLAGTTWAYFTVSVENEGNVIQTAENPRYTLLVDGQAFESGGELANGEHTIDISHDSEADDLQKKSTLYVTFSVDEVTYGYIILGGEYPHSTSVTVCNAEPCVLTWAVSWFMPGNPDVNLLTDNTIQIIAEESAEETTKDSEPEEGSSEQVADSEESEQAEESATATEQEEEVTEETTQNTEDTTETTENSETTAPSETDSDSTNESSDPADTETAETETQAEPAPEEPGTDAAETPTEEETETEDTVTPPTETTADSGENETDATEEVPGGEEAVAETESTAEEPPSTEVMG